ncbi:MAG TPA: PorV/PorQ family protein [Bacteroidota bacterium]|nr:PorV/PorQ family protein [Bacteroidota bacterium]
MKLHFLLIALLPAALSAQGTSTGLVELKIPVSPQTSALAESFVSGQGSAAAGWLNPANLAEHAGYELNITHTNWMENVLQLDALNLTMPFIGGSASFTLAASSVDDIQIREVPGEAVGTFDARSSNFQFSYGIQVAQHISVGFGAKYIYEKIYTDETSGYSCDFGGDYSLPIDGLSVGASMTNIGKVPGFRNGDISLPSMLRIGTSYAMAVNNFDVHTAIAYSNEWNNSLSHLHFGAEAIYQNYFSIRVGYLTGYDARGISAGMGIRYNRFQVNYSFIPVSEDLGNAHSIAVGVTF